MLLINMDLSIIILNYKTRGLVRMCLRGIGRVPPSVAHEIIVIDNDSRDGTPAMMQQEFRELKCLALSENIGFGPGNNVGIKEARGRYIVIMNPDTVIMDDALDRMVAYMDAHPDVGIMGPQLRNPDGSVQYSCYRFPTPLIPLYRRTPLGRTRAGAAAIRDYLMMDWDHGETREVDWVLGACIIMRRELIEKIGCFDERYFLYFEDADLCRRTWEAGWRVVYHPEICITHYHRRESAGSFMSALTNWITREHIKSGFKYFWKYRGKPLPRSSPSEGRGQGEGDTI